MRYLLGKGADPSSQDTFYNGTPMMWALSKRPLEDRFVEVAKLLIAAGSEQVGDALMVGTQMARLDLVEAALAAEQLQDDQLLAAYDTAKGKGLAAAD